MGLKLGALAALFVVVVACGSSDGDGGNCENVQGTWSLTGSCSATSCNVAQTGCNANWACDDGTIGEGSVNGANWSFTTADGAVCSGSVMADSASGSCTGPGLSCQLDAVRPSSGEGGGGGSSGSGGVPGFGGLPGRGGAASGGASGSGGLPPLGGGPGSGGSPPIGGGPGSGGSSGTGGGPGSGGSSGTGGGGSCAADLEACTVNGDCCGFATGANYCVDTGDPTLGLLCLIACTDGTECNSGCCAPLEAPAGAGVCGPPELCAPPPPP